MSPEEPAGPGPPLRRSARRTPVQGAPRCAVGVIGLGSAGDASRKEPEMTEQERMSRETLLKRAAAVAGGAYMAPVLGSAASAETKACHGQPCNGGGRKCRKKGGKNCRCNPNTLTCQLPVSCKSNCTHKGDTCGGFEDCGRCGDGGCFTRSKG